MGRWLRSHRHVDERVEADIDSVECEMKLAIAGHYERLRGVPVRFWNIIAPQVSAAWNKYNLTHEATVFRAKHPRVSLGTLTSAAFFIARKFFEGQSVDRPVGFSEFLRFTGGSTSNVVRGILADQGRWLVETRRHVEGRRSKHFQLAFNLWPPRPGEEVLFVPP
jgi:hypothetical protein